MSRVLIIDDDPILLDTLASTLRFKLPDVHIETVDSALASLERIRSIEYEAIICDGHQPRIEGVALVRAVRKIHPDRPVLLLLKKHDQDLIWQAMNAGAYGLPSHFEAFMACLDDERQASRHYDELSPNLKVKGRDTVIGTQVSFIERLRMIKSYEP